MLPVFFIVLASAALLAALAALFASLRASLGGAGDEATWAGAGPDRGALEDEKNALLRALKDLEYEHEVGKIDDDDYARLERAYRARAKEVLGELDRDLGPYLSRAEALAAGAGESKSEKKKAKKNKQKVVAQPAPSEGEGEPENETKSETKSESEGEGETKSAPESQSQATNPVCPKCSTTNDADASFCKKCATPLAAMEATP